MLGKPVNQRCPAGAFHLELARGFKILDSHYTRNPPPSPPAFLPLAARGSPIAFLNHVS